MAIRRNVISRNVGRQRNGFISTNPPFFELRRFFNIVSRDSLSALCDTFKIVLYQINGFGGHKVAWALALTASWRLDLVGINGARAAGAAADVAKTREDKARQSTRDKVHDAWQQVRAQIAKSRAARAQAKASTHAAQLAGESYAAGAATQLDLIQAQRDAFGAEVARIQADADLVYARANLRLQAGTAGPARDSKGAP